MQKINVWSIAASHLNTLRGDSGKLSIWDVFTFYGIPVLLGGMIALFQWEVPEKAIELSISVFSIFAALLLSVQVALYGVSLRPIEEPADLKKRKRFEVLKEQRRTLMRELNDNISYLILLSVITVSITLIIFFFECPRVWGGCVAVVLYSHFFLTLLMVIKRASIVFSREYEVAEQ